MKTQSESPSIGRALVAGLAGGFAWFISLMLLFGPAQAILANPRFQSEKFLFVVKELEPLPRVAEAMWILPLGILVIGMIQGVVYHFIHHVFQGSWWQKGIQFGLVVWALMVPWFLFYLPWNVMHEPFPLVLLELVLWLGVLVTAALAIAGVYGRSSVSLESGIRNKGQ